MVKLEEMHGAVITNLFVEKGHETLTFVAQDGRVFNWEVEGDCCSQSWFADVMGASALFGRVIRKVEEIDLPDYNVDDGRGLQEVDGAYGYRITTDGGYVDIVFRNSSNGYYGGWMVVTLSTEVRKGDWVEIRDEWQA